MPEQSELLERIAELLRGHRPKDVADNKSRPGFRIWRNGCSGCGFTADKDEAIDHFDHLASRLLSLPGIAIVQLPEAAEGGEDWPTIDGRNGVWINPLTNFVRHHTAQYDADEARAVAAALLAAADVVDAAEAQTNA